MGGSLQGTPSKSYGAMPPGLLHTHITYRHTHTHAHTLPFLRLPGCFVKHRPSLLTEATTHTRIHTQHVHSYKQAQQGLQVVLV